MARQDRPSPYDLVSFSRPPVTEVALSLQFPIDSVDVESFGLFAHKLRDEFPVRQQQPVLPPMIETFDELPGVPSISFQFTNPASMPRLWLVSATGVEVVQLQHDRLTYNWRQMDSGGRYPRYKKLRWRLGKLLDVLILCIDEAQRGVAEGPRAPAANMCEVAYVNPIDDGSSARAASMHPDLATILNRVRRPPKSAFVRMPEDAQYQARWRIPATSSASGNDRPVGRLHLSAVPTIKLPDQKPIYMVNLTARVIPTGQNRRHAMKALDIGHQWVVLGFRDLTTAAMHRHWGFEEEGTK